jgi:hypothetical protein
MNTWTPGRTALSLVGLALIGTSLFGPAMAWWIHLIMAVSGPAAIMFVIGIERVAQQENTAAVERVMETRKAPGPNQGGYAR